MADVFGMGYVCWLPSNWQHHEQPTQLSSGYVLLGARSRGCLGIVYKFFWAGITAGMGSDVRESYDDDKPGEGDRDGAGRKHRRRRNLTKFRGRLGLSID